MCFCFLKKINLCFSSTVFIMSSRFLPVGNRHCHYGLCVPSHCTVNAWRILHWSSDSHVSRRCRSAESDWLCSTEGEILFTFQVSFVVHSVAHYLLSFAVPVLWFDFRRIHRLVQKWILQLQLTWCWEMWCSFQLLHQCYRYLSKSTLSRYVYITQALMPSVISMRKWGLLIGKTCADTQFEGEQM